MTVHRCDVVTFVNNDHALYLPSFGEHPNDINYVGFPERVLGCNQKESFATYTKGTYNSHDHLKD